MRILPHITMGFAVFVALSECHAAGAAGLSSANFIAYSADFNADGCADYLIKAKDDLMVPIPVPSQNKPFILQSTTGCTYNLVQSLTDAQIKDSRWTPANYQVVVGDVRGDGGGSLLIAPLLGASSSPLFNVVRSTSLQYSLLQTLNPLDFQVGTSGSTVSLSNVDSDGRSDLSVRRGSDLVAIYTAGADGSFTLTASGNKVATATAVWNNFSQQLKTGTIDGALNLISAETREKFRAAMTAPGATPAGFADAVKDFSVIDATEGSIRAAIVVDIQGVRTLFFVTFGKESDGTWKIHMM